MKDLPHIATPCDTECPEVICIAYGLYDGVELEVIHIHTVLICVHAVERQGLMAHATQGGFKPIPCRSFSTASDAPPTSRINKYLSTSLTKMS
jgi:hypothetical protein